MRQIVKENNMYKKKSFVKSKTGTKIFASVYSQYVYILN
jgi:hypothetical protein